MSERKRLDLDYHARNLHVVLRDLGHYTPDEYSRALLRLVCVADANVMNEREFIHQAFEAASAPVPVMPTMDE